MFLIKKNLIKFLTVFNNVYNIIKNNNCRQLHNINILNYIYNLITNRRCNDAQTYIL